MPSASSWHEQQDFCLTYTTWEVLQTSLYTYDSLQDLKICICYSFLILLLIRINLFIKLCYRSQGNYLETDSSITAVHKCNEYPHLELTGRYLN